MKNKNTPFFHMMKVLSFFDYFYPAVQNGGPTSSALGLIDNLQKNISFTIITRYGDKGDFERFKTVQPNIKQQAKGCMAYYFDRKNFIRTLISVIKKEPLDCYYFNSFFSYKFTILPLLLIKFRILPKKPVIIAPRGELADGAFKIRSVKKIVYTFFFNVFFGSLVYKYHATSNSERSEIQNRLHIYKRQQIFTIQNLKPVDEIAHLSYTPSKKMKDSLKLVYISRITPKKNVLFALSVLSSMHHSIQYDIYGFIDDTSYWNRCLQFINELPESISVSYKGGLKREDVIPTISNYDALFFPTRGENFGHIILESFIASRPVIISDQTYWSEFNNEQPGWFLSLENREAFKTALSELYTMGHHNHNELCKRAYQFACNTLDYTQEIKKYKQLFTTP